MHIALITHKFVRGDGQGRVNLAIAAAALRRGWRVTLLASEVCSELLAQANVTWVRIGVGGWPTELVRNQVFALASWRWLSRHRREIDVVHANGFITWAAADIVAAHFVHSAWLRSRYRTRSRSLRGAYQSLYTALNALLERLAYRSARRVVAVSEQIRQQLLAAGVAESTVEVIPNGVDTGEFHPGADERGADPRVGKPAVGLFVGDLQTPRKNLHTVLHALRDCPEVMLLVAGRVAGSRYPRLAADLGIADRVRFLGFRRDIPGLMRAVDFVVFPSLYEPSGLVLFEAMASGRPAVTARTVGGLEVAGEGCALVIEDPEDVAAMSAAIRRLSSSPELRAAMGLTGRRRALGLDFSLMAERHCDLFAAYSKSSPLAAKRAEADQCAHG
jgi:glycosyltransferase involved in cell wall biosynthesis